MNTHHSGLSHTDGHGVQCILNLHAWPTQGGISHLGHPAPQPQWPPPEAHRGPAPDEGLPATISLHLVEEMLQPFSCARCHVTTSLLWQLFQTPGHVVNQLKAMPSRACSHDEIGSAGSPTTLMARSTSSPKCSCRQQKAWMDCWGYGLAGLSEIIKALEPPHTASQYNARGSSVTHTRSPNNHPQ